LGYSLEFSPDAFAEWNKLQKPSRERFKKMLAKRIENPRIPSALVSGYDGNVYRLKLARDGLRLIYVVLDDERVIYVVTVGKREDSAVYRRMRKLLD
jgi:mRNA interferase RelE/StbE